MSRVYICVYRVDAAEGWPYDMGDDPSFRASEEYRNRGGAVSWGVCRAGVRNAIQESDVVVFFGAERNAKVTAYRFTGFATVARTITQAEIFGRQEHKVYRHYTNLLIRPAQGGFEHFEPAFTSGGDRKQHKDWLWRIADRRQHRRGELEPLEAGGVVRPESVRFGANYVLFRPEGFGTLILAEPPLVAEVHEWGQEELWRRDTVLLVKPTRRFFRTRLAGTSGPATSKGRIDT